MNLRKPFFVTSANLIRSGSRELKKPCLNIMSLYQFGFTKSSLHYMLFVNLQHNDILYKKNLSWSSMFINFIQIPSIILSTCIIQEEYLTSCYWRTQNALEKPDPSRPPHELYRVDQDQFATLFLSLSPWATGQYAQTLAVRTFRVNLHIIQYRI